MRSWLKNISRIVLIFLIIFVSWHYFKKSASLIKQIKNKSVVMALWIDSGGDSLPDSAGDTGGDSGGDSGIEPEYKEIPRKPSDPDWPQFQADAANPNQTLLMQSEVFLLERAGRTGGKR
jgi:hypothetical protein